MSFDTNPHKGAADVEKQAYPPQVDYDDDDYNAPSFPDTEIKEYKVFRRFDQIASQFHAEIRGIERVPDSERTDLSYWNAASMWMGGNMVVATFAIGCLGVTVFGLTFWDSFLTIIFFNLLGALPVAYYSTFGPQFGLRQMVLSRFWFGYQGVRFIAFLNCIACIGWTAVNTMVSAQMLHTVNNGSVPPWAGCLVIVFGSVFVSFFGYRIVHAFEKFSWIPNFAIFIVVAVRMSKSGAFTYGTLGSGPTEAGGVLSFGGTIFGFATGWSSYAADYTCYMPKSTSRVKVFFFVLAGLCFPLFFAMILGAACATGTLTNQSFLDNYEANSVGGLLYAILVENSLHGFGQFCQVLLALSTISNNIPNLYSLGLSAQTVWSGFRKVPRIVWTLFGCGASLALAIPAYFHFAEVITDFMDLIGYWLAFYSAIIVSEHFIYRKNKLSNYNPDDYEDKNRLPIGIAAMFAICCGIAGAVVGMSQVWYVGVLAKKIGNPIFGGDIGFELAFGFAFTGYNLIRWYELKKFGR
jgi:NCS1 nucleoside transporter family